LWHQLSDGLETLVKGAPETISFEALAELYKEFVASFADKLNQIKLVELASHISRGLPDPKQGFEFLKAALGMWVPLVFGGVSRTRSLFRNSRVVGFFQLLGSLV
jgi:PSD13 N-terminal repeats